MTTKTAEKEIKNVVDFSTVSKSFKDIALLKIKKL